MSDVSRDAVADVRNLMAVVRKRRLRLGMTAIAVAKQIGVPTSTYHQWEAGGHFPPSRGLAAACRAVGLRMTAAHAEPVEQLDDEIARRSALFDGIPMHGRGGES